MDGEERKKETAEVTEKVEGAEEAAEVAAEKAEEAQEEAREAAKEAEGAAQQAEEAAEEAEVSAQEVTKTAEEVKEVEQPVAAPKKEIKVGGKLSDIIKDIESLTVLELADLVKALEDKFGVTAAPPMAGITTASAAGTEAPGEAPEEGQTTFNVVLADSGANKIGVIKVVRELVPTLGLKEAKDLVDAAPKQVLEGVGKDAADEAKQKLEAAGAKVELQ